MITRIVNLMYYNFSRISYYSQDTRRYKSYRPEQKKLRKYLIDNKEMKCIICQRNLPHYLLECAHIKPRCLSSNKERIDFNIVNWMCRNCHKIYDKGDIGITNGELVKNDFICEYDFIDNFNKEEWFKSENYFNYHFRNIFNK